MVSTIVNMEYEISNPSTFIDETKFHNLRKIRITLATFCGHKISNNEDNQ